jgi:hypothetical protein
MTNCVLFSFLTSTGSNGAARMAGRENGLLKKTIQNLSHVMCIDCVAHTLNLSILSAIKGGSSKKSTCSTSIHKTESDG